MDTPVGSAPRLVLRLRVSPGASRSGWAGLHGPDALRLKVQAPAVDGKANEAVREFVADYFGAALGRVALTQGQTSRLKTVAVQGVPPERFAAFQRMIEDSALSASQS
ncbi:MAG: DUF167 domain-containing protein [Deltaproteobacteria bacterium]|nr:DUF167 domain-containing protein [Deltaproteobacteria bacterium]